MAKVNLNFWSRWPQHLETMPPVEPIKYQSIAPPVARDVLNLPQDRCLVLMSDLDAFSDRRPSDALLLSALHQAQRTQRLSFELIILAPNQPKIVDKLPFKVHFLDLRADLSLALAYSAANLLLVPPLTASLTPIVAAIACKTPVVGFNTPGLSGLIDHQRNGYLAEPFEVQDLARGIMWVQEHSKKWGAGDRDKVVHISPPPLPVNHDRLLLGEISPDDYATVA